MLGSVLRVRDLINVVAHQIVELGMLHRLGKLVELLPRDVHLAALVQRVVNLVLLLLGLWSEANAVEVFRCVGVHPVLAEVTGALVFPEVSNYKLKLKVSFHAARLNLN